MQVHGVDKEITSRLLQYQTLYTKNNSLEWKLTVQNTLCNFATVSLEKKK